MLKHVHFAVTDSLVKIKQGTPSLALQGPIVYIFPVLNLIHNLGPQNKSLVALCHSCNITAEKNLPTNKTNK